MSLFSADVRRNPFPTYEQLRRDCPVLRDPRADLWLLFDHDSVRRALTDHETFSSAVIPGGVVSKWLIFLDPPRHARLRSVILRAFTPRAVADLEPRIAQLSHDLLLPILERGGCDLVSEYAVPLPLLVIAELLGAPASDYRLFREWSDVILGLIHTVTADARAQTAVLDFKRTSDQMRAYLSELIADRRAQPQNDLLTRLMQASVDGETLDFEDILAFFQLLLLAGHETTANLISNSVVCLIEYPEVFARLRSEPSLIPGAIEEVLRFRSPVQATFRRTRRDVEIHGHSIPRESLVVALIGSANRDDKHIERADEFDIARNPNPHLAFGHGIHFCIGAALARLETKVALTDILKHMSTVKLVDPEWPTREAFHVHGPSKLPIRFTSSTGAATQRSCADAGH